MLSSLQPEAKRTAIEFVVAYLLVFVFCYLTIFQWDWLEANGLIPDVIRYPCGGRIPSASSAPTSLSTFILRPLLPLVGDDPLLLNSHQNEPASATAYDAFVGISLTMLVYWTSSLCFFVADVYLDQFCRKGVWKSKKHPEANMADRPNYRLYRLGIRLAFVENFVSVFAIQVLHYYVARRFRWDNLCGFGAIHEPLYLTLMRLAAVYFATDCCFYFAHRAAHEIPFVYQNVHKHHHKFVDTYAVCAVACHPLEHIFINIFTVHFPGLVFGVPLRFWSAGWSMVAAFNTTLTHSGFRIVPSYAHDQHHHVQIAEYGTDTICDRIFRTTCRDRVKGIAGTMASLS